jgi:hypothetical protein
MVDFFDLDKQIAKIGLNAVGITDNGTTDSGLIGWLNDSGSLGSGAITNSYVEKIIPDLYLLFYAVATFILVIGVFFYFLYTIGPLSSYSYVVIAEVIRRVFLGSLLVGCATWILGWAVEFSDALTVMFGLNVEIMTFVVDMFTSAYSCIFILLGVLGIYGTCCVYFARAIILGCLEPVFIIAVICWVVGAIELSFCRSIESIGELLIRLILWGLFCVPVMSFCYGVGMGIMMIGEDPTTVTMFLGIMVLLLTCIVPAILFLKFVYNPVPMASRGVQIVTKVI